MEKPLSIIPVKTPFGVITVDLSNDFYGEEFWTNFATGLYEPDTLDFISRECHHETTLLDIGAANGAMTLFAALLGSSVISIEPNPHVYALLLRNLELNPSLAAKVTTLNSAISTSNQISSANEVNPEILSPIVFTQWKESSQQLQVSSLTSLVESTVRNTKNKIVIKMDIEGAEWRILQDVETLASLRQANAKLLLAVHPGLVRPLKNPRNLLKRIVWHLSNISQIIKVFRSLKPYAILSRTNLNPVRNLTSFILLILGGYHEFIVDFRNL